MATDIGAATSKAWKYSTNLDRLKVFFAFYLVAAIVVLVPLLTAIGSIASITNPLVLVQSFAGLFVGIIIAVLIVMFANLTFTHNYAKPGAAGKSMDAVKACFVPFIVATVIVTIITAVVNMVPLVGLILSIIVGLMFFFMQQEVVLARSGAIGSLQNSYGLFRKNAFDTIVVLVVSVILSLLVMIIFAIPLFVVGFLSLFAALGTGTFAQAFAANSAAFVITGLIALFGVSLGTLFSNSMRTDIYMQLKKTRPSMDTETGMQAEKKARKAPKRAAKKKR